MPSESPDGGAGRKDCQNPAESRETGTENGGSGARSDAGKSTDPAQNYNGDN